MKSPRGIDMPPRNQEEEKMDWKAYIVEKNKKFGKEIVSVYAPIVEETGQDMLFVNCITNREFASASPCL